MEDFLGNEIAVADKVVYYKYNKTNASLYRGVVEGLTDSKVRIAFDNYGMRLSTVSPDKLVVVSW